MKIINWIFIFIFLSSPIFTFPSVSSATIMHYTVDGNSLLVLQDDSRIWKNITGDIYISNALNHDAVFDFFNITSFSLFMDNYSFTGSSGGFYHPINWGTGSCAGNDFVCLFEYEFIINLMGTGTWTSWSIDVEEGNRQGPVFDRSYTGPDGVQFAPIINFGGVTAIDWSYPQVYIGNLTLTQVHIVPEPTSFLLLGGGLVGAGILRKRLRNN